MSELEGRFLALVLEALQADPGCAGEIVRKLVSVQQVARAQEAEAQETQQGALSGAESLMLFGWHAGRE